MIWIVPFEKDTDNANYPCIRYRLAAHFVPSQFRLGKLEGQQGQPLHAGRRINQIYSQRFYFAKI